MEKDDITGKLNQAFEYIKSLDDTEEIPLLDRDYTPKPRKKKKRKKKRRRLRRAPLTAILGILLSVSLAIGVGAWYLMGNYFGEPLTIIDTSLISYEGYNGKGRVSEDFHPEAAAIAALQKKAETMEENGKDPSALTAFTDSIVCGFNKSAGLKNGDTITYACDFNVDYAKAARIRPSSVQTSYKVKGLSELQVIDPFEGVTAEWVIRNTGTDVVFNVPELQESLGISYRWSYGTESNTYNGEFIYADADYSSADLAAAGYVIEIDKKEFAMGNLPVMLDSLNAMTYDEQISLVQQVIPLLEEELNTCGHRYYLNGQELTISGYSNGYLTQNSDTAWYEPDTAFTITFDLKVDNPPSGSFFSSLYTYSISYSGTIYRLSDGTVQFNNESKHGCYFGGYIGIYHVAQENETGEIFGNFNDFREDFRHTAEEAQQYAEDIYHSITDHN